MKSQKIENGNIELAIIIHNIIYQYKGSFIHQKITNAYHDFILDQPLVFQIPNSVRILELAGEKTTNYDPIIQRIHVNNQIQALYIQDIDIDLGLFVPDDFFSIINLGLPIPDDFFSRISFKKKFKNLKHIVLCEDTYLRQEETVSKLFKSGIIIYVHVKYTDRYRHSLGDFSHVNYLLFKSKHDAKCWGRGYFDFTIQEDNCPILERNSTFFVNIGDR